MRITNWPRGHSDTWFERLIAKQWAEEQKDNPDLAGRRITFESITYIPRLYSWEVVVEVTTDPPGTKLPTFLTRLQFIVKRKPDG